MSEQRNVKLFVSNLGSIVGPDRILYKPGDVFPVEKCQPAVIEMYLDSGQLVGAESEVGDPIDVRRAGGELPIKGPKSEGEALTEREFGLKGEAGGNEDSIRAERDRLVKEAAARQAEEEAELELEDDVELEDDGGVDLADFEDQEMSLEEARELGIIDD